MFLQLQLGQVPKCASVSFYEGNKKMSSTMRKNIQTSVGLAVGHEETEMKRAEPQRGGAGRGGYTCAARCGL